MRHRMQVIDRKVLHYFIRGSDPLRWQLGAHSWSYARTVRMIIAKLTEKLLSELDPLIGQHSAGVPNSRNAP